MRLALGLLVILVGTARADEAKRTQLRLAAETHARDAKAANDTAKYVACGQAYLDMYNDDPKASAGDEALYNAAVCFEEGRSLGAAITAHAMLAKSYPNSKMRPKSIARNGKLHERIGQLAKAAALFEEYGTKYAGEKDAPEALSDATLIRRGLGDDDKAIENTKFVVRNLSAKRPTEAARAMFALGPLYAKKSAAAYQQHLREWIRTFGGKEEELRAIALVDLGESLWKSACGKPDADGLCIQITRDRVLPLAARTGATSKAKPITGQKRCGPKNTTMVAPIARDAKLVAEAMKSLDEGEKAFARMSAALQPHAIYARAKGRLLIADKELEEYVALRFPADLDFTPNTQKSKASVTKFNDYITQKTRLGQQAQGKLSAIANYKDPTTTIAAMQRHGFLQHTFGLELMNAAIPKDVGTGEFAVEKMEAFCDKMMEVAEPLLKRASEGYDLCLTKGSQIGILDATTRACARDRAAIEPTTFALSTEMLPALPIGLPAVDEAPVRPAATHPQDVRDALAKLSADYRTSSLKNCATHLRTFEGLARSHKLADVEATVGFLQGRCGKPEQARAAYRRALQIDPKHAIATSNLGELEYRAGNVLEASKYWAAAIVIDAKLFGARVGLGTFALATLRAQPAKDPQRPSIEGNVEFQAANAAALGGDTSPAPYVLLSLLATERGQPQLARYYLDYARRIDDSVHVALARATMYAATGNGNAFAILDGAATAWPSDDTHFALAVQHLALRRYDDAHGLLAKVQRRSYEVSLARGIALRGQGNLAGAEKRYAEAIAIDAARPEAHFALGVLWKDYTGARAPNATAAKAAFKKAADAFRKAGTPDAKALADDCDKAIAALP